MDELNDEMIGRLQGYVEWAAEAVWHKQNSQKKQSMEALKKSKKAGYEASVESITKLCDLVAKRQVPLHNQKLHIHEDIRETMATLKSAFGSAYAELFVEGALYAAEMMHDHAHVLHDVVAKQAKLLVAVNQESFEDYVPQILFLYEKEQELDVTLQQYAEQAAVNSVKVLEHVNQNYFVRLKKLATDQGYVHDQSPQLIAGYAVALCSKTLATIYGVSGNFEAVEKAFLNNVHQNTELPRR